MNTRASSSGNYLKFREAIFRSLVKEDRSGKCILNDDGKKMMELFPSSTSRTVSGLVPLFAKQGVETPKTFLNRKRRNGKEYKDDLTAPVKCALDALAVAGFLTASLPGEEQESKNAEFIYTRARPNVSVSFDYAKARHRQVRTGFRKIITWDEKTKYVSLTDEIKRFVRDLKTRDEFHIRLLDASFWKREEKETALSIGSGSSVYRVLEKLGFLEKATNGTFQIHADVPQGPFPTWKAVVDQIFPQSALRKMIRKIVVVELAKSRKGSNRKSFSRRTKRETDDDDDIDDEEEDDEKNGR